MSNVDTMLQMALAQSDAEARIAAAHSIDVTVYVESTDDPSVWWLREQPPIYPPPAALTGVPSNVTAEDLVELAQRAIELRPGAPRTTRVSVVEIRGHLALEAHDGREGTAWTVRLLPDSGEPWELAYADEPPVHALTRRDHERELPGGTDPLVREIHLTRTASARHESRVRATKLALARAARGYDVPGSQRELAARWVREPGAGVGADPLEALNGEQRAIAGALVAMDAHGIGGPGGLGGPQGGTDRMFWARDLGTGRRLASDGPAWMAALAAIDASPAPEDVERAAATLNDDDAAFALTYAMHRAYEAREDLEASSRWCAAARRVAGQIDVAASLGGCLAERYGLEIGRAS